MRPAKRRPDGLAEPQFGPKAPSPRDVHDLIGTVAQLGANVVDDQIEVAGLADDLGQILAQHRLGGSEDRRLDPAHPFAPARRRWQVLEFRV